MNSMLHSLIINRESHRIINPDREIEPEKIEAILKAAQWAPSCGNKQSWRFVISQKLTLEPLKNLLSRGNQWAMKAPLILSVITKPDLGCQLEGRDYAPLDLGLAIENILLQGVSMGLVMHPIAGFDENGVKQVLGIPADYRIYALIIAGYSDTSDHADERTIEKESSPRERKSLDEIVFQEKWKSSIAI